MEAASLFCFANRDKYKIEEVFESRPGWKDTIIVFTRNKGAVVSLFILLIMIVLAVFGPSFNKYTYDAIELERQNLPPRIPLLENVGIFDGTLSGKNMYEIKGFGDQYFWFGTDNLGRDLFTRFCCGTRISLLIGAISALLNILVGVVYGLISGYYGGKLDIVMQRAIEVLNGIPNLVIVSLLVIVLKPGMISIIIAMAISQWTGTARLVRANTLRIKEAEHIMASRTLGTGTINILFKEIFPNLLSSVIVMAMMSVPGAIFMEAFLSFVGLGIPNPEASLGSLINDGYQCMLLYPYQLAIPAIFFAILMLSLNIIGDGLRDALDPSQKQA
ncbi:MAG: ABC transporter permease [Spirochaetales bacterium]|nr:ABC transporter permease [Spirochaetales bacterium]